MRSNCLSAKTRANFAQAGSIAIPGSAPSGLALSADARTLYVALNLKHAVAVVDLATRQFKIVPVGTYPYTVVAAGTKMYVSNWGGRRPDPSDTTDGTFPVVLDPRTGIPSSGTVSVLDAAGTVVRHIDVGLHPSAMVASPAGNRVYVANANSDTISVIDTESDRVISTLNVRLFRTAPLGSAPNALALSRDGKTLYVANAREQRHGHRQARLIRNPSARLHPDRLVSHRRRAQRGRQAVGYRQRLRLRLPRAHACRRKGPQL